MQTTTPNKKTDSISVKEEKMHNDNEFSSDVDSNYQYTCEEKLDMKEFASAIREMGDQFYSHYCRNDESSQLNECSKNIRQICTSYETLMNASENEEFQDNHTSILQKISDEFYKHHCTTDVASHSTEYGENITKICAEYKSDLLNNIGTEHTLMNASENEEFQDNHTSILQKISDEFYKHHCTTDVASHSTEYGENITKICAKYKSDLLNNIGTEHKIAGDELYDYKSPTIAQDTIHMQKFNPQSESYKNLLDEITLHISNIGDVINDKLEIKGSSIDDSELQNDTVATNFSDGINNISAVDSTNISHIFG